MNNQEFDKAIKDMTPREIVSFTFKAAAATVVGFFVGRLLLWLLLVALIYGFFWIALLFA